MDVEWRSFMYVKEECSREDRGGTRPERGRAPSFESRRFRAFEGALSRSLCKFAVGLRAPARWHRRRRACTRAAASSAEQHTTSAQRRLREAAGGSSEPAAEEATDVEVVSAADVLAGV